MEVRIVRKMTMTSEHVITVKIHTISKEVVVKSDVKMCVCVGREGLLKYLYIILSYRL